MFSLVAVAIVTTVGSFQFSNETTTATKTSLENIGSRYSYNFAIFPIHLTCTMWPNSNRTGGNGVQVETENETFSVVCSRSPQNLEFGHFVLFGRVRAGPLFFSLNPNGLRRSRCHRRRSILNSLLLKVWRIVTSSPPC